MRLTRSSLTRSSTSPVTCRGSCTYTALAAAGLAWGDPPFRLFRLACGGRQQLFGLIDALPPFSEGRGEAPRRAVPLMILKHELAQKITERAAGGIPLQ